MLIDMPNHLKTRPVQTIDKGIAVRRTSAAGGGLRAGDFVVPKGQEEVLAEVARATGVDFRPLQDGTQGREMKRLRIGMYQGYLGGNMDEGWTRFLLEQFGLPFSSLKDAELKKGDLNATYDVIILPDDSTAALTGERLESARRFVEEFPMSVTGKVQKFILRDQMVLRIFPELAQD